MAITITADGATDRYIIGCLLFTLKISLGLFIKFRYVFLVLSHAENIIFLCSLFDSLLMRYSSFALKNLTPIVPSS